MLKASSVLTVIFADIVIHCKDIVSLKALLMIKIRFL